MKLYRKRFTESAVRGVRLYEMREVQDAVRGHLTVAEFGSELPFTPVRYFMTYQVPSRQTRGEHAHRRCEQFLISVAGACRVVVDDGESREEFVLDRPTLGLYLPPMVWASEFDHTPASVLMVLASRPYEPGDYIREYPAFVKLARQTYPLHGAP